MLEHNVYIIVADGQRAHIYRNSGSVQTPHLETLTHFEHKNPLTHEQGTDKPGTVFSGPGGTRSHVEGSDYHEQQEHAFARDIIHTVTTLVLDHKIEKLIWVLPPRMLAEIRHHMPHQLKEITIKEINKDLTKHSPQDIMNIILS